MTTSPAVGEGLDIAGLRSSLPALLSAYARALTYVKSEPTFRLHHVPASPSQFHSSSRWRAWPRHALRGLLFPLRPVTRPLGAWWRGFAIHPVVKLFVDTHISAKMGQITPTLRQARLALGSESTEKARLLEEQLWLLEHGQRLSVGWSKFVPVLRFAPAIGMLFSLGIIAISFESDAISGYIIRVLNYVPVAMLVLYPLLIRFGFRWKRAIFLSWPIEPPRGFDLPQPSDERTHLNIYELENRLYHDLGITKKREIPVDVVLHPAPYWLVMELAAIILLAMTVGNIDIGSTAIERTASIIILLAFFLVPPWWTWRVVKLYRRRRASGMV